ncbi:MAG: type I-F CRISPR-associated helicase Cas3f [bacterium]
MMVTFVSQCEKKALGRTRRVLDAFADRIGDNTWQTVITEEGLKAVKKLLRKTASKNTAVSCHWIRSRSRSELVWVVGNRNKFDEDGRVPVNSTHRAVLKTDMDDDWYSAEDIKLLSQIAALLHDLGKASIAFQNRLKKNLHEKNIYRHEWVSLRLFLAFVGNDEDERWLRRMISPTDSDDASWTQNGRYWRDGIDKETPAPFTDLQPLAAAIAWLVVTHHRLPVIPSYDFDGIQQYLGKPSMNFSASQLADPLLAVKANWNEIPQSNESTSIKSYWSFKEKLPFSFPKWRKRLAKLAEKLLQLKNNHPEAWLNNPYVMHLSRLTLMLADHHYSSLPPESKEREQGDVDDAIYANTHKDGSLKQTLTEHLLGVARLSGSIAHCLPVIEKGLPRLAAHQGLKKRSRLEHFRWQDKAADAATKIREASEKNGAFIINMASTGCGKTLANARILYALAKPEEGMRVSFALGLRTLTLQTGRSYREDLHLDEDELAIRVGGSASHALFDYYEEQAESTGSASVQELIEEDGYIEYEGLLEEHPILSKVLSDSKIKKLLAAPVLVCTIDHLMPATEAQRAGRQIAPMLRLMSSDLVLDELDDFDINDLPALTRLIHWAGLLGTRVLISSATLPPSLVEGMYQAYLAGRQHFFRNRSAAGKQGTAQLDIPCLWVDEFTTRAYSCATGDQFSKSHLEFIDRRVNQLDKSIKKHGAKRRGVLKPLTFQGKKLEEVAGEFAVPVRDAILEAHEAHFEICPVSGKRVSFGLVRMANIEPLLCMAKTLFEGDAPTNVHLHICVYHSRFPLLLRSRIEHQLDTTLNRRQPSAVYEQQVIRESLDTHSEQNHIFVVLGSPVTEVGRDHDYDWAIVEPSSMRSLIQLAGRVQRHRQKTCERPNILIFNKNLRHFYQEKGSAVFVKPGFELESKDPHDLFRLNSHNLEKLLREDEYKIISAKPRIFPQSQPWDSQSSLVDLEHSRLAQCMLPVERSSTPLVRGEKPTGTRLNAASNWLYPQAALTWALPQHQPFRLNQVREETLLFLPDDDEEKLLLHRVHQQASKGKRAIYTAEERRLHTLNLDFGRGVSLWGEFDLITLLRELAEAQELPLRTCAQKFTVVNVTESTQGWWFHPALGFGLKKQPKLTTSYDTQVRA